MKTYILITILILTIKIGTSQNWHWSKQIGGNKDDRGITYIDSDNNIYCFGDFYNNCFFQTDTLYSNGANDLFLVKYDANGNELWVKGFGGDNPVNLNTNFYDESRSRIAIDNNNNIYITGKFRNQMIIDGHSVISKGYLDYFIAKFDSSGNCLWIKRAGSNYNEFYATIVNVQDNGDVFWTVTIDNAGTIDTLNSGVGTHLISLTNDGNIISINEILSGASLNQLNISNNEMIMCGELTSSTLIISTDTFTNSNRAFVAKLNIDGSLKWIKRFGRGWNSTYALGFETDNNNNTYLTGEFNDTLIIDSSSITLCNTKDLFICKFDSIGNLIWTKQSNTDGMYGAGGIGIKKEDDNNFYVYGYINGNAVFGNYSINATNASDGFVAKYNNNGDCKGVFNFGYARVSDLDIDSDWNLFVSGVFLNTVNFENVSLSSYSGSLDMFLAKCDAITTVGKAKNTTINNQLVIYANPMQGKCNITVPEEFANEKELNLKIYDNTGKQLQNAKLVMIDNKVKIDLNNEAKGIYNVVLSNGVKSYGGKIVFE